MRIAPRIARGRTGAAAGLLTIILGCSGEGRTTAPAPVGGETPDRKEAIQLLLRNLDVSLKVDPSCAGVGTGFEDKTIGDYLGGFLAEFSGGDDAHHWIDASCEPAGGEATGTAPAGWTCDVVLHRSAGEEEWGWGVRFRINASDRSLSRDSIRCLGAG